MQSLDIETGKPATSGADNSHSCDEQDTGEHHVILQVELATKSQARIMQWVMWVLLLLLLALAIVLVTQRHKLLSAEQSFVKTNYYVGMLVIAAVSLAVLLAWAVLFALRMRRVLQQRKQWSTRQKMLVADAVIQLGLQILNCAFWVGPIASVVGSTCIWPSQLVAAFGLVRWTCFTLLLLWLLVMMHGMTRRQQLDVGAAGVDAEGKGGMEGCPVEEELEEGEEELGAGGMGEEEGGAAGDPQHAQPAEAGAAGPSSAAGAGGAGGAAQHSSSSSSSGVRGAAAGPSSAAGAGGAGGAAQHSSSSSSSGVRGAAAGAGGVTRLSSAGAVPRKQAFVSRAASAPPCMDGSQPDSFRPPAPAHPARSAAALGPQPHPAAAAGRRPRLGPAPSAVRWMQEHGGDKAAAAVAAAPARAASFTLGALKDLRRQVSFIARDADHSPAEVDAWEEAAPGQQLLIDCSWGEQARAHWPKLLLWAMLEVAILLQAVRQWTTDSMVIPFRPGCNGDTSSCTLKAKDKATSIVATGLVFIYAILYYLFQRKAFKDHASLPYSHYRLTNIYIRVQVRHVSVGLAAIVLSMLVLLLVGLDSCWMYLDMQLGALPTQLTLVIVVLANSFLYMPATSLGAPMVQSMLQQFSWTEAGLPSLRRRRNAELASWLADRPTLEQRLLPALLPHLVPSAEEAGAGAEAALAREPVFCMERAVRLFYWAWFAYTYEVEDPLMNPPTALRLFGLEQWRSVSEPTSDTHAVLGWGGSGRAMVLAFRGTASMQNVWTDLRATQARHQPTRRVRGVPVRVHAGFYEAWRQGGFRERVLEAVREAVEGGQAAGEGLTLHVTGHSLGGALAVLAAYDLRSRHPAARISVYTFGAPRVGGRAWYLDYSAAVPDTWGIINSQDPVPRIPKLFYKRSGERVTVFRKGDIIVRPSFFELSVINKSGGSVSDHMMGAYALALGFIMKAQFLPSKCLPGGEAGVRSLVSTLDVGEALLLDHVDLKALQDPALMPQHKQLPDSKDPAARSGMLSCSCAPWLGCTSPSQDEPHHQAEEVRRHDPPPSHTTPPPLSTAQDPPLPPSPHHHPSHTGASSGGSTSSSRVSGVGRGAPLPAIQEAAASGGSPGQP